MWPVAGCEKKTVSEREKFTEPSDLTSDLCDTRKTENKIVAVAVNCMTLSSVGSQCSEQPTTLSCASYFP